MPELDVDLIIAVYELAAEPPGVPWFLKLLFSLESDSQKRWVIFEAHRSWPKLFLKHIQQYSSGAINTEEYQRWLASKDLIMTKAGLRFANPRH
jgi:hypothetical protein